MKLVSPCPITGCWYWLGYYNPKTGQPRFDMERRRNHKAIKVTASNASLSLHLGRKVKQANHTCDRNYCVNPAHLYEGTQAENMRDKVVRGRARNGNDCATHCIRGHAFTGGNLFITRSGKRQCRACDDIRRGSEVVTLNGHARTILEWAQDAGISIRTIMGRLYRGWPPEKALTQRNSKHAPLFLQAKAS